MEKAYRNLEFLGSAAARPLRILSEYLEPRARLQRHNIYRSVAVWGSARLKVRRKRHLIGCDYYRLARDFGAELARWTTETHAAGERYHVLTGAGQGIMEAAHEGAASVNRNLNVGLNISLPYEQVVNPYIPEHQLFEFHYFFMRKFWFANLASALVVFPGGFGTLDELSEILTLMQTGKSVRRPVILFGSEFWNRVLNLELLAELELIEKDDLTLFQRVDTVEEGMAILRESLPA